MTKQEFLTFSLPYRLKIKSYLKSLSQGYLTKNTLESSTFKELEDSKIIPILYPLTDLTKPIEHNGEVFVPIEKLKYTGVDLKIILKWIEGDVLYLKDSLKLIEWHFDIAGLIEKSEAIDVNTLTKNPYK